MEKTWIASFIFVTTLYRARQRDRRGNREGEGEGGGERSVVERGWGGGANGEDLERSVVWREDGEGGLMEKTWIASFIFVTTLYRARQRDRRGNREGGAEMGGGGDEGGTDLECRVHFCHSTILKEGGGRGKERGWRGTDRQTDGQSSWSLRINRTYVTSTE